MNDSPIQGNAAGVSYIAFPPERSARKTAPVVFAWHLQSPPMTPEAFSAAVPLTGVDAWRVYLTLPLSGDRMPEGGQEAVQKLGYEDAVRNLQVPILEQATREFPDVLRQLRDHLGFTADSIGLMGGSMGSAVAAAVALDVDSNAGIAIDSVVLISPISRLSDAVDATARAFAFEYPWDEESRLLAQRYDFVSKARQFGNIPVLLVVGSEDDQEGFVKPSYDFASALENSSRVVIDGMPHVLVDDEGIEPAPQNEDARKVDLAAAVWLNTALKWS